VAVGEVVIESREALLLASILHIVKLITVEREIINIAPIKRSGIHWKTRRHGAIGWMITLFCPALQFHSAKPKSLLSP
jgi:hypothetical protein